MPKQKNKDKKEKSSKTDQKIKEKAACTNGFNQGHEVGFAEGREVGFAEGREVGFREGVHHIVMVAEEEMAKGLKFTSRQKLAESGKLPAYWITALVRCLGDEAARPPKDAKIPMEAEAIQEDKTHA